MVKKKKDVGIKDLFLNLLTKIGCQYTIDEEDDSISFSFQGEKFYAWTCNKFYVCIWDYNWMTKELNDITGLSRIKDLINEANGTYGVTTTYYINEEANHLAVNCSSMVFLMPQIPDVEDYLKIELHQFFRVHRFIEIEEEKRRQKEEGILALGN